MCTVTFVHSGEHILLTSNRDEARLRPDAEMLQQHNYKGITLYFPKDPQAGGTWFVMREDGGVLVLLNGADTAHVRKDVYRCSRGLMLLELAVQPDPLSMINDTFMTGIEACTIIYYDRKSLYQLRWNELHISMLELDPFHHYIWSSATLYSASVRQQRQQWFDEFMHRHAGAVSAEDMLHFHTRARTGDVQNGLVINRNNLLMTKNVTQYDGVAHGVQLQHYDLMCPQQVSLNIRV